MMLFFINDDKLTKNEKDNLKNLDKLINIIPIICYVILIRVIIIL